MTQNRPAFCSTTSSKARHVTPPGLSIRAVAGRRPAAVSSHRFLGQPDPHFLVHAPPRDACFRSNRWIACHSQKPRFDQTP